MDYTADITFKSNLKQILSQPWEVDNRAKWKDESPVKTKRIFGVTNRYDLSREFPILTLRPINWKAAIDEILWIWQKRSSSINELNSNIWDQWADKDGMLHNCYGNQMAKPSYGYPSQTDYILGELTKNPTSRRLVTCMWDTENNHSKSLLECAFMTQWNVNSHGELNMILYQRSQDFLVANNWNVVQYAALQMFVAKCCGLAPGELIHMIGDCHVYNKHEEEAHILLNRDFGAIHTPTLLIGDQHFYEADLSNFAMIDYDPKSFGNTQLKFDVAV